MKGKRLIFFDPEPRTRRTAARALRATQSELACPATAEETIVLLRDEEWDLAILEFDPVMAEQSEWVQTLDRIAEQWPKTRLVMHATAGIDQYIPLMHERPFWRNMIARNDGPPDPEELIITSEKILRRDIFGIEKYLLWGVDPLRLEIRDSSKKNDYLDSVCDYATQLGCSQRIVVELIETIVDELVTNAIYNAPRNPDGTAKYRQMSRSEEVHLEDHEAGELLFACDGNYIAIAQSDPFGALTPEVLMAYLARCLRMGPDQVSHDSGGAGLGLYRVFQSISKFIVNLDPGKKTEIITLIDLRMSMKRFRQAPKSFHVFVEDTPIHS